MMEKIADTPLNIDSLKATDRTQEKAKISFPQFPNSVPLIFMKNCSAQGILARLMRKNFN
jgi:hypothetical protein